MEHEWIAKGARPQTPLANQERLSRKSKRAAMHDSPYRHTHIHLPPRLPERELDSFGLIIHPNGFGLLFVEPHDKLLLFDSF